jgi:hypothetical protein
MILAVQIQLAPGLRGTGAYILSPSIPPASTCLSSIYWRSLRSAGAHAYDAAASQFDGHIALTILIVAALIGISTRWTLFFLQWDIPLIRNIAQLIYATSFGRWRLFRNYRNQILRLTQKQFDRGGYIDLPFSINGAICTESLRNWLNKAPGVPHIKIIADPGAGKSFACQWLASRFSAQNGIAAVRRREPVIVEGFAYGGDLVSSIVTAFKE